MRAARLLRAALRTVSIHGRLAPAGAATGKGLIGVERTVLVQTVAQALDLSFNRMGDEGFGHLLSRGRFPRLSRLSVQGAELTADGAHRAGHQDGGVGLILLGQGRQEAEQVGLHVGPARRGVHVLPRSQRGQQAFRLMRAMPGAR